MSCQQHAKLLRSGKEEDRAKAKAVELLMEMHPSLKVKAIHPAVLRFAAAATAAMLADSVSRSACGRYVLRRFSAPVDPALVPRGFPRKKLVGVLKAALRL